MSTNEDLIRRFYSAFQQRDAATMAACYAPDVQFSDPVFTDLRGADAGNMWKMLCERGKDLKVEFRDLRADAATGSAHWEAWYTFSASGRKVHNVIDAAFEFRDGKIVRHTDRFDLYRWARQALGPAGLLLGWTPMLQNRVRAMAAKGLQDWNARR
ncbi:MAG: nuclear transport factor 2 family protein [Gammaproteobacteria bacterium]